MTHSVYRGRRAIVLGFIEGCVELRLLPMAGHPEGEVELVEPQSLTRRD